MVFPYTFPNVLTGWAAILDANAGARAFYKFYCSQQSRPPVSTNGHLARFFTACNAGYNTLFTNVNRKCLNVHIYQGAIFDHHNRKQKKKNSSRIQISPMLMQAEQ